MRVKQAERDGMKKEKRKMNDYVDIINHNLLHCFKVLWKYLGELNKSSTMYYTICNYGIIHLAPY